MKKMQSIRIGVYGASIVAVFALLFRGLFSHIADTNLYLGWIFMGAIVWFAIWGMLVKWGGHDRLSLGIGMCLAGVCMTPFLYTGGTSLSVFNGIGQRGVFSTPAAEYRYGYHQQQWTVTSQAMVCETLPPTESDGRIAAMLLAQNPDMKKVLVAGYGLGLCQTLLRAAPLEALDWAPPEPAYAERLLSHLPEPWSEDRFQVIPDDIRNWLARHEEVYDLILVNVPSPDHVFFQHCSTEEFFSIARKSLTINGILGIAIPKKQVVWGAVLNTTLGQVMQQTILVPGDRVWFLSAKRLWLQFAPSRLQERFERLETARQICDPGILDELYDLARSREVEQTFTQVDLPLDCLINRDRQPALGLVSQGELWRKMSEDSWSGLKQLRRSHPEFLVLLTWLGLLLSRWILVLRERQKKGQWGVRVTPFDIGWLMWVAGWTFATPMLRGISDFQLKHGTLSSCAGVFLALFVGGVMLPEILLRLGGWRRWLTGPQRTLRRWVVVWIVLLIHGTWMIVSQNVPWTIETFVCGLGAGVYITLVRAESQGFSRMGYLWGWAGALMGTLIWMLVTDQTLTLGLGLLGITGMMRLAMLVPRRPAVAGQRVFSGWGIGWATLMLSVVFGSYYWHWMQRETEGGEIGSATVRRLVPQGRLDRQEGSLTDGQTLEYWQVYQGLRTQGYVFSSRLLGGQVYGFGGRMELLIYVDTKGTLLDYRIIRSNETPRYLRWIAGWMETLKGRPLFGTTALNEVQTVSGATYSTRAIRTLLSQSGQRFAREILQWEGDGSIKPSLSWHQVWEDKRVVTLSLAFLLSLVVMKVGGHQLRIVWLAIVVGTLGWWLNIQYGTEPMMSLLHGDWPSWRQGVFFIEVLMLPVLLLCLGNLYCGYLCPFGALQELLSLVVPRRWRPPLNRDEQRWPRLIKYGLLAVWVVAYLLSQNKDVYSNDPLIWFFGMPLSETLLTPWMGFVWVGVFLFPRFWCRTLCPAGAFLSLFNLGGWFSRWLPPKKYGACEFGLTGRDHLDCIYCDRCRHPQTAQISTPRTKRHRWFSWIYLGLSLTIALWLAGVSLFRLF